MTELDKIFKWISAYEMALIGYSVPIIAAQENIEREKCRAFVNKLAQRGYNVEHKQRLQSSKMLLRNKEDKIYASLFMLTYIILGGNAVYRNIECSILEMAFEIYPNIQGENTISNLDINSAWSMAKELRDGDAYMKNCVECDMPYFISINEHTTVKCPFCPPKNKRSIFISRAPSRKRGHHALPH